MRSYGNQQQAYAGYDAPIYRYQTSNYPTARDRYTYSPSSSPNSRSQEPARHGYTYAEPPSYAYGYNSKTNSTPHRSSTYVERERRHDRIPSDEYYRGRASPDERERYVRRDNEGYGYESPRGSPPPPYESDDYEDRFYDEQDREAFYDDIGKSTKSKTYTYSRPVEETPSRSRSKKEKGNTKTPTTARKTKSDTRPAAEPSKYKIRTTTSSSSTQPSQKSKTSFFSFGRKPSTSKPAPPQRTAFSKTSSRSQSHTYESSQSSLPRAATAADAYTHSIPTGFSLKNWDPTRRPILLLGSVFDCNSLGKWIYDWTVHRCGPMSAFADMAGDLWVLLIGLGGRCSRGERWVAKASAQLMRRRSERQRQEEEDDIEMAEEFLDAGERLWARLEGTLEACEEWMYRAARRSGAKVDSRTGRVVQMGMESGCECVDSLFGRDRELEATEKLMASIRLWTVRFDRNVEEVMMGR